uniref:Uncharacterized protein n=1 Tax=Anguilla anguilla TaxID=7936 RepID=A0A0E9R285_ANGAN
MLEAGHRVDQPSSDFQERGTWLLIESLHEKSTM